MRNNAAMLLCSCLSVFSPMVFADDDTQLRLQHSIDRKSFEQPRFSTESRRLDETDVLPGMVIDGQEISVERNAEDVSTALYLSVMHRQWQAVLLYLDAYRSLPDHEPSLVRFAEGALLRAQGHLTEAEAAFAQAAELQPGNQVTRLELARVQFENHKSGDSRRLFRDIWQHLDAHREDRAAASIQRTVEEYLRALEQRQTWQGSLSIGSIYDNNINHGSERSECRFYLPDTDFCLNRAQGADALAAHGLDYEGTLSKYLPLRGHHGLAFRSLAYGRAYRDHSYYNELTWNISAGYAYRTARDQWSVAALYEINRLSNRSEFDALGARAEWMHLFSPDLALRIEGDFKDMRHARYSEADTRQSAGYATLFKVFPEGWMLFGGLDVVDRLSEERYMNSYLQHGIRLGASTPSWGGIRATLFSSWRERLYNRYNPLFDKRRSDGEQNHTLILQAPRFSVLGLTPSVVLRHSRVKSNVDWLYSYDKNSISLKLEYQFN